MMRNASYRAVFTLLLSGMAASAAAQITIGQGAELGTDTAGKTYYEEFTDWRASDVRGLDEANDSAPLGDGLDASRDLVAFYSRFEENSLFFRADLLDLAQGAESGGLDLYILIDCAEGGTTALPNSITGSTTREWDIAVATYDAQNFELIRDNGDRSAADHLGSYFRSDLDAVELGIAQSALTEAGWDGASTTHLNVFTAKDFGDAAADSIDFSTSIPDNSATGRAKFATIAHGNQSLNRGDNMRDRIFIDGSQTGTGDPSGFRLTLDTHTIFDIPLNIHMSSTLISAIGWIEDANPAVDGGAFLADVGRVIDADQQDDPGALIGGVFAEHIMPFFNGPVNLSSINHFDAMAEEVWGIGPEDMKVMHTPERVINSVAPGTGADPFDDIAASNYTATYLDEVAHLRDWLYPSDPWTGIGGEYGVPRQHKIHLINGIYTFLINDMEDQYKFWPQDGGANQNWRENLLRKAMEQDQAQLTLIFDDWEALAGYSFGSGYNNNAVQYNTVMRWVANHPWIEVVTLAEILDRATDSDHPLYDSDWVVNQGEIGDQPFNTYDYLHHATEDSYENWYDGSLIEESFRDAVPVIDGSVGAGTEMPSGKIFGELGTPGTIIEDTWQAVLNTPQGNLRALAEKAYHAMIYETAWHDEDNTNYDRDPATNYTTWLFPDTTPDRVSGWAFTLHNHLRGVGLTTAAAQWVEDVKSGAMDGAVDYTEADLDQDGQDEYVASNRHYWLAFERRGGRCVQGYYFDSEIQDAISILGSSPINNPTSQGEEEGTTFASRCSGFKEMNNDAYADDLYTYSNAGGGISFTSSDGQITKRLIAASDSPTLQVEYTNNTGEDVYTRFGVSVNNLDLLHKGQNFDSAYSAQEFSQSNRTRGALTITAETNSSINELDEFTKYVIPLTEQMEVRLGQGSSTLSLTVPEQDAPGPDLWMIQ